jgi:hypothetical protein
MIGFPERLRRPTTLLLLAIYGVATAIGYGLHVLEGSDHAPTACHGPASPHLDGPSDSGDDCPICHVQSMGQLRVPASLALAIVFIEQPIASLRGPTFSVATRLCSAPRAPPLG